MYGVQQEQRLLICCRKGELESLTHTTGKRHSWWNPRHVQNWKRRKQIGGDCFSARDQGRPLNSRSSNIVNKRNKQHYHFHYEDLKMSEHDRKLQSKTIGSLRKRNFVSPIQNQLVVLWLWRVFLFSFFFPQKGAGYKRIEKRSDRPGENKDNISISLKQLGNEKESRAGNVITQGEHTQKSRHPVLLVKEGSRWSLSGNCRWEVLSFSPVHFERHSS